MLSKLTCGLLAFGFALSIGAVAGMDSSGEPIAFKKKFKKKVPVKAA